MSEQATQCSEKRVSDHTGWGYYPCVRPARHTEDDKPWCWQHRPSAVKKRKAESAARYNADFERHVAPSREIESLKAINAQLTQKLDRIREVLPMNGSPTIETIRAILDMT